MKPSSESRYVPGYDLFKLIVAIILTIILIILLLRESQTRFVALDMATTKPAILPTMTSQPPPSPTPSLPVTSTEIPAISSPQGTETLVAEATPAPTQTAVVVVPPSAPAPSSDPNECPSNPTRIQVGNTVFVQDWLNFRTGPGLNHSIQRTNRPGTEMEVIGGPVCTIRGTDPAKAYLWWNVRIKDGREGWSAEAPLNFPNYFLEPIR